MNVTWIALCFTLTFGGCVSEEFLKPYAGFAVYNPDVLLPICEAFAEAFADAAANFTRCFIVNSRPLTLCANCVMEYLKVMKTYQSLEDSVDTRYIRNVKVRRACVDWILNADRIMAVQQTKHYYENLWKTSQCPNCFSKTDWKSENMSYTLAEHFTRFQDKSNATNECFKNYTTGILPMNYTEGEASKACADCKKSYSSLNSFYLELDDRYGTDLCMDIVDSMNYTRLMWGHTFNCTASTMMDGLTITVTVLILIIPVVFYVASHIHYQRIEKKIVTQNRMRRRHPSSSRSVASDSPANLTPVELHSSPSHSSIPTA